MATINTSSSATEASNFLFDFSNRHLVCITNDRHHQSLVSPNRNANMGEILIDDIRTINFCVHCGNLFESMANCHREEPHKAKLHAVFFLKKIFVRLAQVHDRLHVHFIESSQNGCSTLGINKPLRHSPAKAGHSSSVRSCTQWSGSSWSNASKHLLHDMHVALW